MAETKTTKGGYRGGSGRPKGAGNKKTKAQRRKIAYDALVRRVTESSQSLITAQMNCALGISHLFKVETNRNGRQGKSQLITDEKQIADYLAGKLESKIQTKSGKMVEYYYIATKAPDTKAADSLLDRAFGKASQPLVGGAEDDPAIQVEGFVFVKPVKKEDEATNKSAS